MTVRSKTDAMQAGLTRYFTGKPCKYGHVCERMVSNRRCVECLDAATKAWGRANLSKCAEMRRAWIAKNPERNAAMKAAWNKVNPEGQAARSRKWFLENKEKANAATRAWSARNMDKEAAKTARRRAATQRATPAWVDLEFIESFYTLARIYRDFGHEVEVDHIAPLQGRNICGLHVHENLQVIPMRVNRSKSNRFQI